MVGWVLFCLEFFVCLVGFGLGFLCVFLAGFFVRAFCLVGCFLFGWVLVN